MSDKTLTEQQKALIDAIDKRFYRSYLQVAGMIAVVFTLISACIPYGNFITKCLFVVVLSFIGILSTSNWAIRTFIRHLTEEERILINQTEFGSARSVLVMNAWNVEKELLRASQITETGNTLLRASTHSDTPEDQLLHPAQHFED